MIETRVLSTQQGQESTTPRFRWARQELMSPSAHHLYDSQHASVGGGPL